LTKIIVAVKNKKAVAGKQLLFLNKYQKVKKEIKLFRNFQPIVSRRTFKKSNPV
jgi:hypothetical protein